MSFVFLSIYAYRLLALLSHLVLRLSPCRFHSFVNGKSKNKSKTFKTFYLFFSRRTNWKSFVIMHLRQFPARSSMNERRKNKISSRWIAEYHSKWLIAILPTTIGKILERQMKKQINWMLPFWHANANGNTVAAVRMQMMQTLEKQVKLMNEQTNWTSNEWLEKVCSNVFAVNSIEPFLSHTHILRVYRRGKAQRKQLIKSFIHNKLIIDLDY